LLQRVESQRDGLTKTGRKVAKYLLTHGDQVAFGTVADVAHECGVGVASVHRLALQLGYSGFTELQDAARSEMSQRLRPAAEKIRATPGGDAIERVLAVETRNIESTVRGVDKSALAGMVKMLVDEKRRVLVASGDASQGVAAQFASEMAALRDGVEKLSGNSVAASAQVARSRRGDVIVVVDFHRYDAWLIEVVEQAAAHGMQVWTVSDSRLSPLGVQAHHNFEVAAESVSPFDSHVGALVFFSLVVTMVAETLRNVATKRVDAVERAWRDGGRLRES
jgi:DNA-binding MurR/RpiR family transcriptional regulator